MVIAHDVSLLRHKSESVNGQRPGENILAHLCESLSLGWWTFLGGLHLWSRGERFSLALEPNSTYVFIWRLQSRWSSYGHSIHLKFSWQFSSSWCWDVVSVGGKHHLFWTSRAHLLWSRWSKGRLIDPVVESQTNLSLHSVAFRKVFFQMKSIYHIL